jgi:23S rRNA pseudouridine1911/1915/1917 synthase
MHENGKYRTTTFASLVTEKFGKEWSAVHRLDKETSGLVLCAANMKLRQKLAEDLAQRRVQKEYQCIVSGIPAESCFRIDAPIGDLEESEIRIKKWVMPGGLEALTDFEVVKTLPATDEHDGFALLKAFPKTGRTNQIRIHAAYTGYPLIGDKLYHPDEGVFLQYFKEGNSDDVVAQAGFWRHALHASYLRFVHPHTDEMCDVRSELYGDLQVLWNHYQSHQGSVGDCLDCQLLLAEWTKPSKVN